MTAFERAWSVLKSDPRSQAFQDLLEARHPDLTEGMTTYGEGTRRVMNLGTIDPRAILYSLLGRGLSRKNARVFQEFDDGGYGSDVDDFRSNEGFSGGFTSQNPEKRGSVSRESRPVAYRQRAPEGTPQRLLEDLEEREFGDEDVYYG